MPHHADTPLFLLHGSFLHVLLASPASQSSSSVIRSSSDVSEVSPLLLLLGARLVLSPHVDALISLLHDGRQFIVVKVARQAPPRRL